MIKYVVEYVFFERARVWMYLLCDEVALLFFFWIPQCRVVSPVRILLFPRHDFAFFLFHILNPNFQKTRNGRDCSSSLHKSDVNGCVA